MRGEEGSEGGGGREEREGGRKKEREGGRKREGGEERGKRRRKKEKRGHEEGGWLAFHTYNIVYMHDTGIASACVLFISFTSLSFISSSERSWTNRIARKIHLESSAFR